MFVKKRVLFALMALLFICMSFATATAATVTQDGLEVTLTTNKTAYSTNEEVIAYVVAKNVGSQPVNDLVITLQGPSIYSPASEGNTEKNISILDVGEQAWMSATFRPFHLPQTGDSSNIVLWLLLIFISATCFVVLMRCRIGMRMMALLLAVALGVSGLIVPTVANAESGQTEQVRTSFQVVQEILIGEKQETVVATVSYLLTADPVTREEWIYALMDVVGIETNAEAILTFDDHYDAQDPLALQTAIDRGILPTEIDRDYVQRVRPKDGADREFIARTTQLALGLQYAGNEQLECADISELHYVDACRMALDLGMLELVDGSFCQDRLVTSAEKETSIAAIHKMVQSADVSQEQHDIEFMDGVTEVTLFFENDAERKEIILDDELVGTDWEVGKIYVLHSSDASVPDIAIKVTGIERRDGRIVVTYSTPELYEVVEELSLVGLAQSGGYFVPADDVTVTPAQQRRMARAASSGTLDLFQKFSLQFKLGDIDVSGSIEFESLEYRLVTSSIWRFPFISVDEIYAALNSSFEVSFATDITDFGDDLEYRKLLGRIAKVPLAYGLASVEANVYFVVKGSNVSFEVSWGFDAKTGLQYTSSNWVRPVFDLDADPLNAKIKGSVKAGFDGRFEFKVLEIDLAAAGIETGAALTGDIGSGVFAPGNEFCGNVNLYWYFSLYGEIGEDDWGDPFAVDLTYDVVNENNSPFRKNTHFEETGYVPECTRGKGSYTGTVIDGETGQPIYRAKITLYKLTPALPEDVTFTDIEGAFSGTKQAAGTYTMRVTAGGYQPYECSVDIIGGDTTHITPRLMLSRETTDAGILSGTISGRITDAMTGGALGDVTLSIYSMALPTVGRLVTTVRTDSSGQYTTDLDAGAYEFYLSKDGYISKAFAKVVVGNDSNVNASLNPVSAPEQITSLRTVLHWGAEPRDLDSHLVGPQNGGSFHTYYADRVASHANLDVDIVEGFGPETTTIVQHEPGKYSFYVHDYTNRSSYSSSAMSHSGAYVELYNGNNLLYTINIPTGRDGTVWHVFDYDGDTGLIALVNEFSYQESPSAVGMQNTRIRTTIDSSKDIKPYSTNQ